VRGKLCSEPLASRPWCNSARAELVYFPSSDDTRGSGYVLDEWMAPTSRVGQRGDMPHTPGGAGPGMHSRPTRLHGHLRRQQGPGGQVLGHSCVLLLSRRCCRQQAWLPREAMYRGICMCNRWIASTPNFRGFLAEADSPATTGHCGRLRLVRGCAFAADCVRGVHQPHTDIAGPESRMLANVLMLNGREHNPIP
jgi:hypothetical protein